MRAAARMSCACVAGLLACGPEPAQTPATTVDDHPPGRSDCAWAAEGCGNDGCPEEIDHRRPVVAAGGMQAGMTDCGSAAPLAQTFAEVARELRDKPALSMLAVVAPTRECANAVRDALEREVGVATSARVEIDVRPGERYVHFDVSVWNGKRCATGALTVASAPALHGRGAGTWSQLASRETNLGALACYSQASLDACAARAAPPPDGTCAPGDARQVVVRAGMTCSECFKDCSCGATVADFSCR